MSSNTPSFPLELLPSQLRPVLAPGSDPKRRMMVARAMLPMPPEQLLTTLAYLCQDEDESVRQTAGKSLQGLPQGIVEQALKDKDTHPGTIHQLVFAFNRDTNILSLAVLNRNTDNVTLEFIAENGPPATLAMLVQNQARIAEHPPLVEIIYYNRKTDMASSSRLMEFAVRERLPIFDMKGYNEIAAGILGEEEAKRRVELRAKGEEVPEEPFEEPESDEPLQALMAEDEEDELVSRLLEPEEEDPLARAANPLDSGRQADGKEGGEEEDGSSHGGSLADKLRLMTIPQRLRLALMGNKSARGYLIADTSKLVAAAVCRNPGFTEREVADAARNRSANEAVVRIISNNREWTKNYHIKMGLVSNPRTPLHKAISILKSLTDKDLKKLGRSREIPSAVARMAKRLVDEREKAKKRR